MVMATTTTTTTGENATIQDLEQRSSASIIIYSLVLSVILLLSVVGNICVVIGVMTTRHLRMDISNTFIVNLSITDMSNAILVMLFSLIALCSDDWRMGTVWCQLQCAFNYCFIIVSMLTLAMISIDRYHAIKNALNYQAIITKRRIYMMIAYTWIQGIAFAAAPVILQWVKYDYTEIVCAIDWFQGLPTIIYVVVAFIVCFMVPSAILIFCYTSIAVTAKKLANSSGAAGGEKAPSSRMAKTIKSLIVVVAIFFICMTPFCVTKVFKVVANNPLFVPGHINTLSSLVQYVASATNPFIYGIFRKDFRLVFRRQWRRLLRVSVDPEDYTTNSCAGAAQGVYTLSSGQGKPSAMSTVITPPV